MMTTTLPSSLFGSAVFTVGILNLILIHPVPGIAYLLVSSIYFPPVSNRLTSRLGFTPTLLLKIILGVILILFTLGVSDLGELID